jgi:hypothetical protein
MLHRYTTSNSRLRTIAKGMAKVLLDRLEAKVLTKPVDHDESELRDDFFECMFLVSTPTPTSHPLVCECCLVREAAGSLC